MVYHIKNRQVKQEFVVQEIGSLRKSKVKLQCSTRQMTFCLSYHCRPSLLANTAKLANSQFTCYDLLAQFVDIFEKANLQQIQVEHLTVSVVVLVVMVELIALQGKMTEVARWE